MNLTKCSAETNDLNAGGATLGEPFQNQTRGLLRLEFWVTTRLGKALDDAARNQCLDLKCEQLKAEAIR